jgi:putative FmdB family regulatory protein
MPIYEYRCSSCGFEKEFLQKISDAPMKTCPQCAKDALIKKVTAAGFQLKGSGWYASDFKTSGSSGAKKAEPKPAAEGSADKKAATGESKTSTSTPAASTSSPASGTSTPASGSGGGSSSS